MYFELNAVFSLSIVIGAVIGWMRFRKIDPAFLPFLLLLWLGFINEIISLSIMEAGFSNAINYNVFTLVEALLITWQFKKWKLLEGQERVYYFLQFAFITGWIIDE